MALLNLDVITPVKKTFWEWFTCGYCSRYLSGSFQVLYNHAPLISTFEIGRIKLTAENGEEKYFATSGGTIEVLNNKVLILADSFESPSDIDMERAKEAKIRAQERLKIKSEIDVSKTEAALARAINRISIHEKYPEVTR